MPAPPRTGSGAFATDAGLDQVTDHDVPDSEFVILCSFGLNQDVRLTERELRRRLIDAGFRPATTPHLVRSSRLIAPLEDRRYGIRPSPRQ